MATDVSMTFSSKQFIYGKKGYSGEGEKGKKGVWAMISSWSADMNVTSWA
jgi:hypothetical protein